MAIPQLRNYASNTYALGTSPANLGPIGCTVPADTQAGDILVLLISIFAGTNPVYMAANPDQFTLITDVFNPAGSSGNQMHLYAYRAIATAGQGGTFVGGYLSTGNGTSNLRTVACGLFVVSDAAFEQRAHSIAIINAVNIGVTAGGYTADAGNPGDGTVLTLDVISGYTSASTTTTSTSRDGLSTVYAQPTQSAAGNSHAMVLGASHYGGSHGFTPNRTVSRPVGGQILFGEKVIYAFAHPGYLRATGGPTGGRGIKNARSRTARLTATGALTGSGYVNTVPITQLVDDFSNPAEINRSRWPISTPAGGNSPSSAGVLLMDAPGTSTTRLASGRNYQIGASQLIVWVDATATTTATVAVEHDSANSIAITVGNGQVIATRTTGGVSTTQVIKHGFDPAADRWLRIRGNGPYLYTAVSRDGQGFGDDTATAWTPGWDTSRVRAALSTTGGTARFDKVNLPATFYTHTFALTATGTVTGGRGFALFGHFGTLTATGTIRGRGARMGYGHLSASPQLRATGIARLTAPLGDLPLTAGPGQPEAAFTAAADLDDLALVLDTGPVAAAFTAHADAGDDVLLELGEPEAVFSTAVLLDDGLQLEPAIGAYTVHWLFRGRLYRSSVRYSAAMRPRIRAGNATRTEPGYPYTTGG